MSGTKLYYFVLCVLLCTIIVKIQGQQNTTNVLKIGVLATEGMNRPTSLFQLAADYINFTNVLPSSVALELIFIPTEGDTTTATIGALDLVREHGVQGVVGGSYSPESTYIQVILRKFMVPQISPQSTSVELSNKASYPYFMRTVPADNIQASVIIKFLLAMEWKHVVFVYSSDEYGIAGRDSFLSQAASSNISSYVVSIQKEEMGATEVSTQIAAAISTNFHVTVIFAERREGQLYMSAANESGLIGEDYVYIYTDSVCNGIKKVDNNIDELDTRPIYDGSFGIRAHEGIGDVYQSVLAFANQTRTPQQVWNMSQETWYGFDCVYTFAQGCAKMLSDGVPFENITGALYLQYLKNLRVTGQVHFDVNGDRSGYFDIFNFDKSSSVIGAIYDPETDNLKFYGGSTKVPVAYTPMCTCVNGKCVDNVCVCTEGWSGTTCNSFISKGAFDNKYIAAIVGPVFLIIIGISIGACLVYKKKKKILVKNVELNQRSKFKRQELALLQLIGSGAVGDVYRATLRGGEVAAKRLLATNMSAVTLENYKLESAMMCGLRHPNLVLFMGSCHDKITKEMFLVMEFMTRGSLHDVLHNKSINLPYGMQIHIALQAAQGMNFLHQSSPPILHRDLKSHNEKWNAKISDFGMTKTKENVKHDSNGQELGTLFWTAPEVLNGLAHSEKSDCYAFGIILWEIFHRVDPYANRDPMAVALDVLKNSLRPSIARHTPTDMIDLMRMCWDQSVDVRPSFADIVKKLRALSVLHPIFSTNEFESARTLPMDTAYLVSTTIDNAASLWEDKPNEMLESMDIHNSVLRKTMKQYHGYEANFKEHGFLIVFSNEIEAVNFCLSSQLNLLSAPWPHELLSHPAANRREENGELIRAGLRVRMALHCGNPDYSVSTEDARISYYGPVVDQVTSYLACCRGGEIVVSASMTQKIDNNINNYSTPIWTDSFTENGSEFYKLLPLSLQRRSDDSANSSSHSLLNVIIDIEDQIQISKDQTGNESHLIGLRLAKFAISAKELKLGERLGRGNLGECFKAAWEQKEVVAKKFFTQSFNEDEYKRFMHTVSHMTKIKHSNIIETHGACFEEGNVGLVMEYAAKGNLRQILSNHSIPIDGKRKVQFLIDAASALVYLGKQDDSIRIHKNLKSQKLLVSKDWTLKLHGFGFEKAVRTITSVGGAAWTAPEMWTESHVSSEPASVYAFGVIMWEIYTRQVPFDKWHPIKLCQAVIAGERPAIPPNTPTRLSSLMKQCWDPVPSSRPSFQFILSELKDLVL